MPTLCDPRTIGRLHLPNRIIMAPMTRSRADDAGVPSDLVHTYYAQRASAGLIVSEATNVSAMAKGYPRTPGLFTAAQVAGWRTVTDAVHGAGGRIFAQLFHTGRVAVPAFLPDHAQPVGPSAIAIEGQTYTDGGMVDFVVPRALDIGEIPGIVAEFAGAARDALEAGFDGVELHAASGYLIQQFLDAAANTRTDGYGGSPENRARLLLETIDAMADAVGAGRVGIKLSPQMPFNGNVEPDADAIYPIVVRELSKRGLAYLHVGRYVAHDWHAALRPLFNGPFLAGSGFDGAKGEALLQAGGADAIVYGKYFVSVPNLPDALRHHAKLPEPDTATDYAGGEKGYTDYLAVA